jgi:hypothetical protein
VKHLSLLLGGVSATATAFYLVVYLYRWQWNRALICGVLFVAVEVFLLGVLMLGRISRLERRIAAGDERAEDVRRRLEQARLDGADHFRWIDAPHLTGRTRENVFIPVLLGLGVVLSGISWLLQRIAGLTVTPATDRHLAGRLTGLTAPAQSARVAGPQLEDQPPVPRPRRARTAAVAALAVAAAIGGATAVDALGDATQTRPEQAPDAAATTLVLRVETRNPGDAAHQENAARDLWEDCRHGATAVRLDHAELTRLDTDVFAVVVRPALTDNDLTRLRGCLLDANTDGVQATILGEGHAGPTPWLP